MREETRKLLELGREGGYIFSPAHAVEGDVSLENMLAAVEMVQAQSDRAGKLFGARILRHADTAGLKDLLEESGD